MRKARRLFELLLILALCAGLAACGNAPGKETAEKATTRSFTDSVGRTVELPERIERVIPSGNMAMMFVYPLAADKLAALADPLSDEALRYLGEELAALPTVGNLYKTGTQMNVEELANIRADVFIDFGEAKETVGEDLDALQSLLGIPCVFISGTLENAAASYRLLGELLGQPEEAERCAAYIETIVTAARNTFERVEKKDAVILNGTDGLGCVAAGSFQDEIWAFMLRNAAVVADAQMYKSTAIDLEQLANWDPEYLFFYNSPDPATIVDGGAWRALTAVKNGRVFAVPSGPWGYSYPPSVNRYLAVLWLSELLYPGEFDWDARALTKEFYELFYHYELSDAEYETLFSAVGEQTGHSGAKGEP